MISTLRVKKLFPSAFCIVLLLNLTLSLNAFSATWENISKNESVEYSYDKDSIIGSAINKEIYIKVNILKDPKEGDKSRLLRFLINCSTSTLLLDEIKRYSEFELKGVETVFKGNTTETTPKPNTVGQRYIDVACGASINKVIQPNNNSESTTVNSVGVLKNDLLQNLTCQNDKRPSEWNNCLGRVTQGGRLIEGSFQNGKLNGYGSVTEQDGSRYFGNWINGSKNSVFVEIDKTGRFYGVSDWKIGEKISSGSGGKIPPCNTNKGIDLLIGVTCIDSSSIRNITIGNASYKYYDAETSSGKYKWAADCERKLFGIANFTNLSRPYFNTSPERFLELTFVCDPKNIKLQDTTVEAILNSDEAKKYESRIALMQKEKANLERKQWNEYKCTGNRVSVVKNIQLENIAGAITNFAFHKSEERAGFQMVDKYNALYANTKENASFGTTTVINNNKGSSVSYSQPGGGIGYQVFFNNSDKTIRVRTIIGGVTTVFNGTCSLSNWLDI